MAAGVLNILSSWVISEYSLNSKEVVLDMFEFLVITILIFICAVVCIKNNIFFDYIRITIKAIGFEIEIKSKEKSAPSHKD